jgi:hypothetical protein
MNTIIEQLILEDDITSIIYELDKYEFNFENEKDLYLAYYYLSIKSILIDFNFIPLMKKLKSYSDDTKAIYYIIKYKIFAIEHFLTKLKKLNVKNKIINLYTQYHIILSYLNLYNFDIFKTKIIELYHNIDIIDDYLESKIKLKYFIYNQHIQYLTHDIVKCDKPKNNFLNEISNKIKKSLQMCDLQNFQININEFKNKYNFPNFVNTFTKHIDFLLIQNKTKDDILNYCQIIDYSLFGTEYHSFIYCSLLISNINRVRSIKNYELYNELMIILISKSNIKEKFDLKSKIKCTENAHISDINNDRSLIKMYIENKLNNNENINIIQLYDYILSISKTSLIFLNIFEKYKNYLLYIIFSTNINRIKISLSLLLLSSIIETNSYNYIDEIKIILKYYLINEKNIIFSHEELRHLTLLKEKINNINYTFNLLNEYNFKIIKTENNNNNLFLMDHSNEKICIICLEEINNNIRMIQCNKCLKYISHINCLIKWLNEKQKCPYCNK